MSSDFKFIDLFRLLHENHIFTFNIADVKGKLICIFISQYDIEQNV